MNPSLPYGSLHKQGKAAKSRKPIRRRTSKRASEEARYNRRVKEWLPGKRCAVFPARPATQNHHKFGRRGKLLLWEPGWVPVSEMGHDFIHNFPKTALKLGLLCDPGQWNDQNLVK